MSRRHLSLFAAVLTSCLAGFLLMAALSHAQVPGAGDACTGDGMLDDILCKYKTASGRWSSLIQRAAEWLFWTLVVINMVWTFSMHALRRGDILEILAELTRFTIFVGFFHYLLTNGTYIGETIINSLRMLAAQAGGVTNALRPSGIIDVGLEIVFHVISRSSILSLLDGIFGFFMAAFILVVLATVAIDMLQLLVAAWFLLYAGVFFLGFGGSKWTSDMAIGYFRTVLSIAVQTFAMILLVGLGKSIIDEVYESATDQNFLYTLGVLVVVAYTIYRLTSRIPPLLGQLVTGSHASGAAAAGSTLADATMLGTSAVATAAYSMGGSLMAEGITQAAGMVEAYRAATGVARSELKSGGSGGSGGAGVGPLAAAFGDHLQRGGGGGGAGSSASSTKGRAATNVGGAQRAPDVGAGAADAADRSGSESGAAQSSESAKPASSADRTVSPGLGGTSATGDHEPDGGAQRAHRLDATDEEAAAHEQSARAAAAQSKSQATEPEEADAGLLAESGEEESGVAHEAAAAPTGVVEEDLAQRTAATRGAQSTNAAQESSADRASQNSGDGATPGQVKAGGPSTSPSSGVGVDVAKTSSLASAAAGGASAAATASSGGRSDGAGSSSTSSATTAGAAATGPASESGPNPNSSTAAAAADGGADSSPQTGPVAAEASAPGASQPTGESAALPTVDGGGAQNAEGVVPGGSARRATSTAAAAPRNDAGLKAAVRSRADEIFMEASAREGKQVASAAIENFRARAAARIANTAGGRMAQSMRQRSGEPPVVGEVAAFRDGGGSIGAPAAGAGALEHGQASARSAGSAHGSAGASVEEVGAFESAESDSSAAPAMRGGHQPTGVRSEDGGKSS